MTKYIAIFFTPWVSSLLLAATLQAQPAYIAHCGGSCPQSDAISEVVVHHLYAAGFAAGSETPSWVAYRVIADAVGVSSLLPRRWQPDRLLPGLEAGGFAAAAFEQVDVSNAPDREYRLGEYRRLQSEQGRLAPLTSFGDTPYWHELNQVSNRAHMPLSLRVGPWARLDQAINALAGEGSEVLVVSGPVDRGRAFFKLLRIGQRASAFVFPRELAEEANFCRYRSSLDSLLAELPFTLSAVDEDLVDSNLLPRCLTLDY